MTDSMIAGIRSANGEYERRRKWRSAMLWIYAISMMAANLRYVMDDWAAERIVWVSQWTILFLSPALFVWIIQSARRRLGVQQGGPLQQTFPSQHVGESTGLIGGLIFLGLASSPFLMLLFRDAHYLIVLFAAFGGILLCSASVLWYDGQPLECRRHGLIVDGLHTIPWETIVSIAPTRRTNMVEIQHFRPRLATLLANARPPQEDGERDLLIRDLFVASEQRTAFLDFVQAHLLSQERQEGDVSS